MVPKSNGELGLHTWQALEEVPTVISPSSQPCKIGPSFPLAGERTEVQRGSMIGSRSAEGKRQGWDAALGSLGPQPMLSKVTVPPSRGPACLKTHRLQRTCLPSLLRPL